MKRRSFLKHSSSLISSTAVLCSLGGLSSLNGCAGIPRISAVYKNSVLQISLSSLSEGNVFYIQNEILKAPVILIRNDKQWVALDSECPHKGCRVNPSETDISCPCHGSRFSREGHVLQGPANRDLTRFRTEITGSELQIHFVQNSK